ncbi:MAG: hypothetical protein Q4Q23_08065, partial [Methanobacteriaceae archaeon]|nr:hypothetical protein [Methanobacteriaceae archaeon]
MKFKSLINKDIINFKNFGIIYSLKFLIFKVTKQKTKYVNLVLDYLENENENLIEHINNKKYNLYNKQIKEDYNVWIC